MVKKDMEILSKSWGKRRRRGKKVKGLMEVL